MKSAPAPILTALTGMKWPATVPNPTAIALRMAIANPTPITTSRTRYLHARDKVSNGLVGHLGQGYEEERSEEGGHEVTIPTPLSATRRMT